MVDLPTDLTDRGWKLVARAPDRLFAVSVAWGGTVVSATIDEEEEQELPEGWDDEHEIEQWQIYYPEEFDDNDDG